MTPRQSDTPEVVDSRLAANFASSQAGMRALARALFRHRRFVLANVIVCFGAAVSYTLWARRQYEAVAVIEFEEQHVDVPQLVEPLYNDNIISTEIQVLQGRTAAVRVIDSLGLRARVVKPHRALASNLFAVLHVARSADSGTYQFHATGSGVFTVSSAGLKKPLGSARIGDTIRLGGMVAALAAAARDIPDFTLRIDGMDQTVRRLGSALTISRPARDADLVDVQARVADPAQAAAIANLMAHNAIVDRQLARLGSTDAEMAFLKQQSDSLGRELRASEDSLRAYQQRAHVVDVPDQANDEVARLAKLQADLAGTRAQRDAFASLLTQFRRDSAADPNGGGDVWQRLMAFPALLNNQSASVLLGALAQAENERSQLLVRRTMADSDVQVLTRRIREVETQLQGMAQSYLQSLDNQVASLQKEALQFSDQLDMLPEKQLEMARLERNTKVLNDLWVLVQTRLKEAQVTGASGSASVRIVDAAAVPSKPASPRPLLIVALALGLGAVLGVTGALALDASDRTVRSRDEARFATGLPVLGALPRLPVERRPLPKLVGTARARPGVTDRGLTPERNRAVASIPSLLVTETESPSAYSESFNQLYANLALAHREDPLKVLVFTSALPGEGKTLSAINFALIGATRGMRVLLIDGDLRCGVVSTSLGISREPGFSEFMAGTAAVEESRRWVSQGREGSLFVMPSGSLPQRPGSFLTIDRIRDVLTVVTPNFDLVVIDTPPVNLVADAGLFAAVADAVLLVVRTGHTELDDLRYARERLEDMGAPVLGTLLNDVDLRHNAWDDGSYRYLAEARRYHVRAS